MSVAVQARTSCRLGQRTATGYEIELNVPWVALPSKRSLRKFVWIWNPASRRDWYGVVLDVGPGVDDDDDYVFGNSRPRGETAWRDGCIGADGAGIVVGPWLAQVLGIVDGAVVVWEFLELPDASDWPEQFWSEPERDTQEVEQAGSAGSSAVPGTSTAAAALGLLRGLRPDSQN